MCDIGIFLLHLANNISIYAKYFQLIFETSGYCFDIGSELSTQCNHTSDIVNFFLNGINPKTDDIEYNTIIKKGNYHNNKTEITKYLTRIFDIVIKENEGYNIVIQNDVHIFNIVFYNNGKNTDIFIIQSFLSLYKMKVWRTNYDGIINFLYSYVDYMYDPTRELEQKIFGVILDKKETITEIELSPPIKFKYNDIYKNNNTILKLIDILKSKVYYKYNTTVASKDKDIYMNTIEFFVIKYFIRQGIDEYGLLYDLYSFDKEIIKHITLTQQNTPIVIKILQEYLNKIFYVITYDIDRFQSIVNTIKKPTKDYEDLCGIKVIQRLQQIPQENIYIYDTDYKKLQNKLYLTEIQRNIYNSETKKVQKIKQIQHGKYMDFIQKQTPISVHLIKNKQDEDEDEWETVATSGQWRLKTPKKK
jgi:hypothetical protein